MNLTRPEGSQAQDFHATRRSLGAMFFAGYALAAVSAKAQTIAIKTSDAGLVAGEVAIPQTDGPLPAYVARPNAKGRFPAVIVVSEVFGVHEYIRDICRRLAQIGYVAIAPAYFHRAGDPAPLQDFDAIQKIVETATNEQVMSDTAATLKWLHAQTFASRNVGITGFCWGGAVVWMAAERFRELKCGVAWYGRLIKPATGTFLSDEPRAWPINIAPTLKSRVLGLYAGKDAGIPQGDIDAMREVLRLSRKADSEIIVYPEATHGFHADYRTSYNAPAAADGWARMLAHFAKNGLKPKAWRR